VEVTKYFYDYSVRTVIFLYRATSISHHRVFHIMSLLYGVAPTATVNVGPLSFCVFSISNLNVTVGFLLHFYTMLMHHGLGIYCISV
jgi:hypothetical protein